MTPILLDTSAYSGLKKGHADIAVSVQRAERIFLSATVLGELRAGFASGNRLERNEEELRQFLLSPRVSVLPIDGDTSHYYAAIHASLRADGTPIPSNDLWIAASAMQHGLCIVTRDTHFKLLRQVLVSVFS